MKRIIILLLLFTLFFGIGKVSAQIDTLFWFSAPWLTPDHTDPRPIVFNFATFSNTTTIRVQQPSATFDTTLIVGPNTMQQLDLSFMFNQVESKPANMLLHTGFKITSDYPITAVYDIITASPSFYNPETYSLKGQNGMGKEFVLPFQTLWRNRPSSSDNNGDGTITQPYQHFSVVATENNTTIYITPKTDIVGHPAGITFSVFLPNKGDVWVGQNIYQDLGTSGHNLAGTVVVSDKAVSITVCEDSVQPYPAGSCADEIGDQMVPVDVIGNEYIVNKGFLNAAVLESFFVVATENFTTITIDDGTTTTQLLNKGDVYAYNITQPMTHILADKPVYVYHMSGWGCELGAAVLPPLNCAGSDHVSFSRANNQDFLLNILCKNGQQGSFTLNGSTTLIPATAFNPVPGTGGAWVGAQIQYNTTDVPPGSANLVINSAGNFALGVINGGLTTGCAYHYLSSFIRKVYTDAGKDTTLCNGINTINLIGSVTGGVTTGIWTTLDGNGALNNPTQLTTTYTPNNADFNQGFVTFVLTSTGNCKAVSDTMKVSFQKAPEVQVGADLSYCKNNIGAIPISGTVNYAVGSIWSGGNSGSFGNQGTSSTTYSPSNIDTTKDSIVLYLQSQGSLYNCPDAIDSLIIHFTPAPSVNPGFDQNICSSISSVNLNGEIGGSASSIIWTTSGSGTFSYDDSLNTIYNVTNGDTAAGVVTIYLSSTNNGNCLAVSDSMQINILSKPDIEILSADSICSNLSVLNLNGFVTPGFNSYWSTDGGGTIDNINNLNTIYNLGVSDTSGFITIYLATDALICPPEKDSMQVYLIAPPQANAGPDQAFCQNQPVQLNGLVSGPSSGGSWLSLGTGSFSPSNNLPNTYYFPSALDVASGNVQLIFSTLGDFGCAPDKDTIKISFKAAPSASFTNNLACEGANTNFVDQSSLSSGSIIGWHWDFGDGDSSIVQNPIHTFPADGNYNISLIVEGNNGCSDTIQNIVVVNPSPIANFNFPPPCQDMPFQIADKSFVSGGNIVAWNYNFSDGGASSDQNPFHTFTAATNFPVSLTVTSNLGCKGDTTINISVNPKPNAAFKFEPNPALALENVNFTDQSTGNNIIDWEWDFADGQGDNKQNVTHKYSNGKKYDVLLTVTDTNGCQDTVSHTLTVGLLPVLPSGFTPNGDGENDTFIIRGGPFKNVIFKVYNNWGQLIFDTNEANKGWDGTFNGKNCPVGVYTWVFKVELYGGRMIKKSGDVTLLR